MIPEIVLIPAPKCSIYLAGVPNNAIPKNKILYKIIIILFFLISTARIHRGKLYFKIISPLKFC